MLTDSTTLVFTKLMITIQIVNGLKGVILKPERMPMPHDVEDDQKKPPGAIAAACVLPEGACVYNVFASECSLTEYVNNKSDVNYLEDLSNK